MRSGTEGARSVTYRAAVPRAELERWYGDELGKAGFSAVQGGWEKSGERVGVHVQESGGAVVVTAIAEGRRDVDVRSR